MRAYTKGKHEIGKRSAIVVAAVLAMIVSVVGWATAGTVAAQAPSCLPTSDRTLGPHGFPGLRTKAMDAPEWAVYTDALQAEQFLLGGFDHRGRWHPAPPEDPRLVHEVDALNSEGFVSGTWQHYFGKPRRSQRRFSLGDATTVQLGSPEQAQAELDRNLSRTALGKRFTVAAIPGSQGVRYGSARPPRRGQRRSPGGSSFNKLSFTDGDYAYVIRRVDFPGPGVIKHRRAWILTPARTRGTRQVTNAAINLYNRVHGAAVCP